jgi:DNA-binding Lrp family transcriptional regulator
MNRDRSGDSEASALRLDALDRRLIDELIGDPRLAYATLGARLGVTGMTAANRLQRLRQADLLRFSVSPNFTAQGLNTRVLGLLQADVSALDESLALLAACPYVLGVNRITGEYDLSFTAVFPSEVALGTTVRDLQAVLGVRRLVVHHILGAVKDEDGWSAAWAEPGMAEDAAFEIVPGVRVPDHLKARLILAANWLHAFISGDVVTLDHLSEPALTFTIMPPQVAAGTYTGFDEVAEQARIAGAVYRHLWHRIIGVQEASEPYSLVVDAFNTAERRKGQIRTAFARMAFGFAGDRVQRVISLGQMELPDLPAAAEEFAGAR